MRTARGCVVVLAVVGAIALLGWGDDVISVAAAGPGQEVVPTSTRPAPPPLPSPTPTPTPKPHQPKAKRSSPAAPSPTPVLPAVPVLPDAGASSGAPIGWAGVLAGGGAAVAAGLTLWRRETGGHGRS